jgi:hypothetical protein
MSIPPVSTTTAKRNLFVSSLKMDMAYLLNQGAIPQFLERRLVEIANLQSPEGIYTAGHDISIP